MSLSDKVEETFEKLKPHHSEAPLNTPGVADEPKSGFSLNLEDLRDYFIVIVCFGIALASIFLLAIPQYGEIALINSNFTSVQGRLAEVQKQSGYLEGLVGLKDELESKIKIADQVLPNTEDRVPYTLDQIIQIADESQVDVESLSLSGISDGAEETGDNLRSVLIQMKVIGSFQNVQEFFYKLENARTIVDITTFQLGLEVITPEDSTSEAEVTADSFEQISGTFTLRSYLKADMESQAVDLSALANSPNYDGLFEKLNSMTFYETTPLEIEFGRENPFDTLEATPSVDFETEIEIPEEIIEETEEEDISGFE